MVSDTQVHYAALRAFLHEPLHCRHPPIKTFIKWVLLPHEQQASALALMNVPAKLAAINTPHTIADRNCTGLVDELGQAYE